VKQIDTSEFKRMWDETDGLAVINALPESAAQEAHIPGTTNIAHERGDFAERVAEQAGGKDRPVVVYCGSEACDVSVKAAKTLEEHGFQEVYDYEGGVKAWRGAE